MRSPNASAPIFVDSSEGISGTKAALIQAILQSVAKPLPINTVRQLTLPPQSSTTTLLTTLGITAPSVVLRNVLPTGTMVGVVHTSTSQSPFFIFAVGAAYAATFSGMLSWEPTLLRDMKSLFPLYPEPAPIVTASSTSATSTAQKLISVPKIVFRDEVVSNHDVRVYRDAQGRSIVLYGYWDPQTLVIARDPAAFTEILARLATPHTK